MLEVHVDAACGRLTGCETDETETGRKKKKELRYSVEEMRRHLSLTIFRFGVESRVGIFGATHRLTGSRGNTATPSEWIKTSIYVACVA